MVNTWIFPEFRGSSHRRPGNQATISCRRPWIADLTHNWPSIKSCLDLIPFRQWIDHFGSAAVPRQAPTFELGAPIGNQARKQSFVSVTLRSFEALSIWFWNIAMPWASPSIGMLSSWSLFGSVGPRPYDSPLTRALLPQYFFLIFSSLSFCNSQSMI
jgi:hypothetical protein